MTNYKVFSNALIKTKLKAKQLWQIHKVTRSCDNLSYNLYYFFILHFSLFQKLAKNKNSGGDKIKRSVKWSQSSIFRQMYNFILIIHLFNRELKRFMNKLKVINKYVYLYIFQPFMFPILNMFFFYILFNKRRQQQFHSGSELFFN